MIWLLPLAKRSLDGKVRWDTHTRVSMVSIGQTLDSGQI